MTTIMQFLEEYYDSSIPTVAFLIIILILLFQKTDEEVYLGKNRNLQKASHQQKTMQKDDPDIR